MKILKYTESVVSGAKILSPEEVFKLYSDGHTEYEDAVEKCEPVIIPNWRPDIVNIQVTVYSCEKEFDIVANGLKDGKPNVLQYKEINDLLLDLAEWGEYNIVSIK